MGSQIMQGKLWGQKPKDWAAIQEQAGRTDDVYVLNSLSLNASIKLLDVGCGSGYFCKLANEKGAITVGIDASGALIDEAKERLPHATFIVGEMEELPFED